MKTTLIDSSFLMAIINPRDSQHAACSTLAKQSTLDKRILSTVIPETCYMLHRWLGQHVMRAFVQNLNDPAWYIEPILKQDFIRVHELLNVYADARLDLVDATLVAAAERLNIDTILTLDRHDFRLIRPRHVDHFTLLP